MFDLTLNEETIKLVNNIKNDKKFEKYTIDEYIAPQVLKFRTKYEMANFIIFRSEMGCGGTDYVDDIRREIMQDTIISVEWYQAVPFGSLFYRNTYIKKY